jgi:Domain of unknown function (DUF397)
MQQNTPVSTPPQGTTAPQGALTWRKSRASNPRGDCVELARLSGGAVAVRNSRDPHGPALVYTSAEIAAFLEGAKAGEFDDLAS